MLIVLCQNSNPFPLHSICPVVPFLGQINHIHDADREVQIMQRFKQRPFIVAVALGVWLGAAALLCAALQDAPLQSQPNDQTARPPVSARQIDFADGRL